MTLEQREPEIHFTIDPSGGVTIEVFGVQGPACETMTKPYADMFAVSETKHKHEYHQPARQQQRQQHKL